MTEEPGTEAPFRPASEAPHGTIFPLKLYGSIPVHAGFKRVKCPKCGGKKTTAAKRQTQCFYCGHYFKVEGHEVTDE